MTKRTKVIIFLSVFIISAFIIAFIVSSCNKTNDTLKTVIAAQIDGIPISASKVEYRRLINSYSRERLESYPTEYDPADYPVDDEGILMQIAKEIFVLKLADEAGISYSDEDIMEMIKAEEMYISKEIERGNKLMQERKSRDDHFFDDLGVTKEQFYETVYIDILRYRSAYVDYGKYYYESGMAENDVDFETYIDDAFAKASITIDVKN